MGFASFAGASGAGGRRASLRIFTGLAAALLLVAAASADDTFVVDSFADLVDVDLVDIQCQTAAGTCTLRAAVMQANLNPGVTTILLPSGLFTLTRLPTGPNGADNGDLNLAKPNAQGPIRIQGAGAASTIVDGSDLDRIFRVESGSIAFIQDLTIRNGNAGDGGGILVKGSLALSGVRVADNVASQRGGGLHVDTAAYIQLDFCDVVANQAALEGGGLYLSPNADGDFYMIGGEIRNNVSLTYGGGLYLFGSTYFVLEHARVSGNRALAGGGLAFAESSAEALVLASTIDDNRATAVAGGEGGGIFNASTLRVVTSTISGNSSTGDGGGIWNAGNATLYNTTVAFNDADFDADPNGGRGGGAYGDSSGTLAIRNSVLAGNYRSGAPVPDDCNGNLATYGHNRFGSFAGCAIAHTGACGGTDLLLDSPSELGPLRYNGGATPTHAIEPGGGLVDDVDPPCVCQDMFGQPIAFDQRDGPRVVGARCDVGAYELGALPPGSLFADGFESGGLWRWD